MRQYIQVVFTERVISCYTLAGVTIQVANLVNYNCHPKVDGNKHCIINREYYVNVFSYQVYQVRL